jgi:Na+-transporting methylmalonyl-CoA/oxaloacetate decarboxylase gamma subunit
MAVLFLAVLTLLVYALAGRPAVSRAVVDEIVGAPVPTTASAAPTTAAREAEMVAQANAVLPEAVAALPAGELVVSEQDLNSFLAARPEAIAPLEQLRLRFTEGQARAEIGAYGLSSEASVSLAAQDGKLVVTNAVVGAPLSYMLSGPELAAALADRVNAELAAQDRTIDEIRIEEGQLVLVTR